LPFTLRNIKQDLEDIGPRFEGDPELEFRAATKALELENSALSYQRVPPGYRFPYGHTHKKQEEVCVVVRGSGRMKVDNEVVELAEWDAVRVPPGVWRGYEADRRASRASSSARQISARIRAKTSTAGATGGLTSHGPGSQDPERGGDVNIEFLSTVAVIAPNPSAGRDLYVGALGLPLEGNGNDYHHSEQIAGCKSFGIWPLSQAAEACFGTPEWPAERPVPQVSIEFDVGNATAVGQAAQELEQAGFALLHPPRKESWGQTVARLQLTEGAIVGISYIPMFHDEN
jgi:quercetin dioxygenase-like cupin family protein